MHDSRKVTFPNSVPLNNPKPPKYYHSNTFSLYMNSRSESKPFRRILDREINFVDKKRGNSWKKTLNSPDIDKYLVKNTFKGINEPSLSAEQNDTLVSFFTKKKEFQLSEPQSAPNSSHTARMGA